MTGRESHASSDSEGFGPASETLLLVSERDAEVIPISPMALKMASGSRARVRRRSVGALIMGRRGVVRRIESVEFVGPLGEGAWKRLFSLLNSDWAIAPVLSPPLPLELEAVKALLARCLEVDARRPEPYLAPERGLESMLMGLAAAKTMVEVFEVIRVPPPEDSLDLL